MEAQALIGAVVTFRRLEALHTVLEAQVLIGAVVAFRRLEVLHTVLEAQALIGTVVTFMRLEVIHAVLEAQATLGWRLLQKAPALEPKVLEFDDHTRAGCKLLPNAPALDDHAALDDQLAKLKTAAFDTESVTVVPFDDTVADENCTSPL